MLELPCRDNASLEQISQCLAAYFSSEQDQEDFPCRVEDVEVQVCDKEDYGDYRVSRKDDDDPCLYVSRDTIHSRSSYDRT